MSEYEEFRIKFEASKLHLAFLKDQVAKCDLTDEVKEMIMAEWAELDEMQAQIERSLYSQTVH